MIAIEIIGTALVYITVGAFLVGFLDNEPITEGDDMFLLVAVAVAWPLYGMHEFGRWLRNRRRLPRAKVIK